MLVLDALTTALAAAGYPLGDVSPGARTPRPGLTEGWAPVGYRIEKTGVGANVNYDGYCGCDAGFALDRSQADQSTESCCCGNHMLVGPGAGAGDRIMSKLEDPARYRVDLQTVTMPWGQPLDVALAIPRTAE